VLALLATPTLSTLQEFTTEQQCHDALKTPLRVDALSLLQHSSVKQGVQRHAASSDVQCGGRTLLGSTPWKQYGNDGIYVDVDTSQCAFETTPVYVSSMGGNTQHWTSTGSSEIYSATPSGFRIYVYKSGITASQANQKGWHINWIGTGKSAQKPVTHLCSGRTETGLTDWRKYSTNGLYVDVDTSKCGFSVPPNYISSMGGSTWHWKTTGSSEIYKATATGFRIYIHTEDTADPATANSRNWHINWVAEGVGATKLVAAPCSGMTTSGSTNWKSYGNDGIYLDVDTSACGFGTTPEYVSSLLGKTQHWKSKGSSEIYSATPNSFRIYIYYKGITPSQANQWAWRMNWVASVTKDESPALMNNVPCGGSTVQGSTAWKKYGNDGIYVDVDTSQCAFQATPEYVTSMAGRTQHWTSTGSSEIYQATQKGFRIYVHKSGITASSANNKEWHINWIGNGKAAKKPATYVCSGKTVAGSTAWVQYHSYGLYVDVDTTHCGFSKAQYVSSMGGVTSHWVTTGSSEIYISKPTGFRIYIHNPSAITPSTANQRKWHINWIGEGVGSDPMMPVPCSGRTSKGYTSWKYYSANGIYLDIDTSACGFTTTPNYVSSLLGSTMHWKTTGSSEIYFATPTSFRVYIHFKEGITAAKANKWKWHLNWMAATEQLPTPSPTPSPTAAPLTTTMVPMTCNECRPDFSKLVQNPLGNDNTFVKYNGAQTLHFKSVCSVAGKDLDMNMEIAPGYEAKPSNNKAGQMYIFNVKVSTSATVKFTLLDAGQPIEVDKILFSVLDLDLGHYGTQWISTGGFSEAKHGNAVLETTANGETKFEAMRHGSALDNPTDPALLSPDAFSSALALVYRSTSTWTVKLGVTGDHNSGRNFYLAGSTQLQDTAC